MNYHNITTDDMLNGTGLRTVLWVSGCHLNCKNCQNPQTHDFNSGIRFDKSAMDEILECLDKPYIDGLTLTGGHPFEYQNLEVVRDIVFRVKEKYPNKSIWIYTGFTWEILMEGYGSDPKNHYNEVLMGILCNIDVLVDGRYYDEIRDVSLAFRGSKNQRIIDVKKSLAEDKVVLFCD